MGIDVGRLEDELLQMSLEGAPGHEFCRTISELARTGRFVRLRDVLPKVVFEELCTRYKRNPHAFVKAWSELAEEMRQGFVEHARQRLTSLTNLRQAAEDADTPVWQEIQSALDTRQNDLLRTAFAVELLRMVEPAVKRATQLRECVVKVPSSADADRYLEEATRCFFFGMFTASAVMCRSVLEEATRAKVAPVLGCLIRTRYRNAATLGNLLHEVNNNLVLAGIDAGFPRVANKVNDAGRKAVHQGTFSEDEARECLQNTRLALELLLK